MNQEPTNQPVPTPASTNQTPPSPDPVAYMQPQPTSVDAPKVLTGAESLKRVFFQILIGCLIGAAAIAVVAVLIGSFSDTLGRSLGTIAVVAIHALLGFSYITETEKRDKKDGGRSIELFSNTVFTLIAVSFMTAVFAVWQLLDSEITLRLYMFYGIMLFATLHADVLYRIRGFQSTIDNVVTANYIFMSAVVVMLSLVIFSSDPSVLGDFYYRLLAALGIIDATMTITAIIMHKLYLQKHPQLAVEDEEANSAHSKNFWRNPFVVLLMIYLLLQLMGGFVALVLGGLSK